MCVLSETLLLSGILWCVHSVARVLEIRWKYQMNNARSLLAISLAGQFESDGQHRTIAPFGYLAGKKGGEDDVIGAGARLAF